MKTNKRNIIFIWIPKTGGSSIWYECLAKHEDSVTGRPWSQQIPDFQNKRFISTGHISIVSLLKNKIITKEYFDNSFKFAFVRNPWDRFVSLYSYFRYSYKHHLRHPALKVMQKRGLRSKILSRLPIFRTHALMSFNSFCKYIHENNIDPVGFYNTKGLSQCNNQADWLLDEKNEMIPDFTGRFENLQKDFERVCDMIGIPKSFLPKTNISKHRHYSIYYNEETKRMVTEFYKKDIELFDYSF